MKFLSPITSFLFVFISIFGMQQECEMLKNNSFNYRLGGKKVLVIFTEDKHVEYHQNKKYFIKSNVEWISECEYNLIIQEATLPDFPFKSGSKLHIKITKVKGDRVYYRSSIAGRTWEGKMVKIEE